MKQRIVPAVGRIIRHGRHVGMQNNNVPIGKLLPAMLVGAFRSEAGGVLPKKKIELAPVRFIKTELRCDFGGFVGMKIWAYD